jgi:hypothetical protein
MFWTKTVKNDLEDLDLLRAELGWASIATANEAFYREAYGTLRTRIHELAQRTFRGCGNVSGDAWIYRYTNEFYRYVRAVGRPDPHAKHWEDLLRVEEERIFLVSAVLMKVIDEKVLSGHLFGAEDRHAEMLMFEDTASSSSSSKSSIAFETKVI